ncbi:lytic transglycosylase domain-containing protein [Flavihumibacter fluvii]|uniref:lytic transglycosylase domain-containing protein n=1 Tax=Flavihumibacter fluvii TaxID=2838157 RepID=UPI001BDEB89C|nr:lytic transglycosylase domain-containing protein [Flavihumibacter fluvii]ULQ53424.1 lytic transglycosylase domain-containing protein [Flavihumibacter fluvii]
MLRSQLLRILMASTILVVLSSFAATPCVPAFVKVAHKEIHISSADYAFERNPRMNAVSAKFIKKYITTNTDNLDVIREKSASIFELMDAVFNKYKLPVELKYLAVVESELNPTAVSRVGAVGTWQLMPATAKILGLKITPKVDERKSVRKSTKAAAIYLRDLHTEFKDWLLVLAAYNCGPGPIYAAMKKSGSKNFWMLQKFLPAESRQHVHKFIATHQYFEAIESMKSTDDWKYMASR